MEYNKNKKHTKQDMQISKNHKEKIRNVNTQDTQEAITQTTRNTKADNHKRQQHRNQDKQTSKHATIKTHTNQEPLK